MYNKHIIIIMAWQIMTTVGLIDLFIFYWKFKSTFFFADTTKIVILCK